MKPLHEMSDEELDAAIAERESQDSAETAGANEPEEMAHVPDSSASNLAGKFTLGTAPLVAGASAVAGYLSEGGSLAESKAIFDQARDDYNVDVAAAEKAHPTLAKVANVGEFISKAIPSGQAANFGISIADNLAQEGLTPEAVAKGAGFAALGTAGGRLINAGAKYVSRWGKAVDLSSSMEKLGVVSKSAKEAMYRVLENKKMDPTRFVERLSEYDHNGAPIFEGSLSNIKANVAGKVDALGRELGDYLQELSQTMPADIPASKLMRSLGDGIDDLAKTFVPEERVIVENVRNELLNLQDKGLLNIKDIHNLKRTLGNSIDWESGSKSLNSRLEKVYFDVAGFMEKSLDDITLTPAAKDMLRVVNSEFSDLSILKKLVAKEPAREFARLAEGKLLQKNMTDYLSLPVRGLNWVAQTTVLDPLAKAGLVKVLTAAAGGMESVAPYVSKISEALGRDPAIINDLIAPAESAVDLTVNPVQRNTDDLLKKDSHVYNLLREEDPALAYKFNKALNDEAYDVVGELMSSMSNLPKMRKFIEPGIGWDGKVTNETEKAIVRERILGADLSVMQQMSQIEQLDKAGIIPQAQPKVELRQLARKPPRSLDGRKKSEY